MKYSKKSPTSKLLALSASVGIALSGCASYAPVYDSHGNLLETKVSRIAAKALTNEWRSSATVLRSGRCRIIFHGVATPSNVEGISSTDWRGTVAGEILLLTPGTVGVGSYLKVGDGIPSFDGREYSYFSRFTRMTEDLSKYEAQPFSREEIESELQKLAYPAPRP